MSTTIFISYRRQDSIDVVGRMYSWLKIRLPPDSVFFDVQAVPGGAHFREHIERVIADEAEVALAVIGPAWLTAAVANGPDERRLDAADDLVRHELEVAFAHKKAIIPVLIQGAAMPSRHELPASIRELADINAVTIRHDPDFESDMRRLRAAIVAQCPSIQWQSPVVPRTPPPNSPVWNENMREAGEEALYDAREAGDRTREGALLFEVGHLAERQGRLDEAGAYYQQALTIRREVGDRAGEGDTLHDLGDLAERQGRLDEAAEYYEQALAVYESIGAETDVQREREALARVRAARAAGAPSDAGSPGEHTAPASDRPVPPAEAPSAGAAEEPATAPARKKRRWWLLGG
jgi:tetratricopeptide (TPR) repeat protein